MLPQSLRGPPTPEGLYSIPYKCRDLPHNLRSAFRLRGCSYNMEMPQKSWGAPKTQGFLHNS